MKFKALITSLVLSTSVRSLSPTTSRSKASSTRSTATTTPRLRDHRGNFSGVPRGCRSRGCSRRARRKRHPHRTSTTTGSGAIPPPERLGRDLRSTRSRCVMKTVTARTSPSGKWLYSGRPGAHVRPRPRSRARPRRHQHGGTKACARRTKSSAQRARKIVRAARRRALSRAAAAAADRPPAASASCSARTSRSRTPRGTVHLPVGSDKGNFQKLRIESTGPEHVCPVGST